MMLRKSAASRKPGHDAEGMYQFPQRKVWGWFLFLMIPMTFWSYMFWHGITAHDNSGNEQGVHGANGPSKSDFLLVFFVNFVITEQVETAFMYIVGIGECIADGMSGLPC
jgi:hypothetical protein